MLRKSDHKKSFNVVATEDLLVSDLPEKLKMLFVKRLEKSLEQSPKNCP